MDGHLEQTPERYSTSSDSVGSHQTLGESSPNFSPNQTLVDLANDHPSSEFPSKSSLDHFLLPWIDDDHSDSAVVRENVPKEDDDALRLSPITTRPYRSSHWAEPWNVSRDVESKVSEWSQPWSCCGDEKPSSLGWPEWPSAAATNTVTPDWTDSEPWLLHQEAEAESNMWSLREENEVRPSVGVSSTWFLQSKPVLVGAGLANLGNTCFLNTVLQCFTHTVPLVQGLLSCNHAMPCDRSKEGFCVHCAFRDHVELSIASTGGVISPWNFVNNLNYISSSFQRYQQEDAHEFLQCFLATIGVCCNDLKSNNMLLSYQDENFVKQVFGGCLVSKLRCCNCDYCSDTYEPSVDLSLEIEHVDTLTSALESFTKVEKIEDPDTKFMCENCKEKVSIEKQYMLDKVPSVAAFHMKRFKNDGFFVEKIDKFVGFPLELDLLPYTSDIQNDVVELKYDLYAVVVHIGFSSTSGHYYCFICSAPGTWYKFDDSKVIRVQEDYVLSQDAYILFYAKRSTPLFSRFLETHKPYVYPNSSNASPNSVLDNVEHVCTCDANETIDTAERIAMDNSGEFSVELTDEEDDSNKMFASMPIGMNRFKDESACEDRNASLSAIRGSKYNQCTSFSVFVESNCNQVINEGPQNADVACLDIYEEPPGGGFPIVHDGTKLVDQGSCKRKLNKNHDDPERKEANKLLKKMPDSTASKLTDVLDKSHRDNSHNRRSRKIEPSQYVDVSQNACRKQNAHGRVLRSRPAGSFCLTAKERFL